MLSLAGRLRDAESERLQRLVVASDLAQPLGEQTEKLRCREPAGDLRQLDDGLPHLGEAHIAVVRLDACPAAQERSHRPVKRKAELAGERDDFIDAFSRPRQVAASEMREAGEEQRLCEA